MSTSAHSTEYRYSTMQFFVLLVARIVEPISYTIIFPFVNQFVTHLLPPSTPPSSIGTYSGLLESLFSLTSFLCMYHWGRLSDRVGRKPVMLVGLIGVGGSLVGFGLSGRYWVAVGARCLGGALSGNASVLRAALGEITTPPTEPLRYSIWAVCWDLCVMLGPAIGALLSPVTVINTGDQTSGMQAGTGKGGGGIGLLGWLGVAEWEVTKRHPFFPACAVGAGLAFGAAGLVACCFEETLESKRPNRLLPTKPRRSSASSTSSTRTRIDSPIATETTPLLSTSTAGGISLTDPAPAIKGGEEDPLDVLANGKAKGVERGAEGEAEEKLGFWELLRVPAVKHALISIFLLNLCAMSFDAVFVLFAYSPPSLLGLSLLPTSIAACLSLKGLLAMPLSLLFFPYAKARWGLKPLYRFFASAWVVIYVVPPVMNMLVRGDEEGLWVREGGLRWAWVLMVPVLFCYVLGDLAFPLNMMALNIAAPSPSTLGAVNGMSLSVQSLARSIGPVFIGYLYSVSAKYQIPLVWAVFTSIAVISLIQSWKVQDREPVQDENKMGQENV